MPHETREHVPPPSPFSLANRAGRAAWSVVAQTAFARSPKLLYEFRANLLRTFGAKIGRHVHIAPTTRIWAPWNLVMEDNTCLGADVDCYNAAPVTLREGATVSQYSYLCTASHDHEQDGMPGFQKPIEIGPWAWVCADVYVAPGVTVGAGAVIGARSSAYRDIDPWVVVAGNPARKLRERAWRPVGWKAP